MTARKPVPGDVVLIRATVADQGREYVPVDDVWVSVRATDAEPERVLVSTGLIAEVLGPSWMPPRHRDVVIDRDGVAWQYEDHTLMWESPNAEFATDDLVNYYGPLTLVSRGGKPVAP
ncbi:MAG TPA: hypothetical protein VIS06_10915 [Mycobacteriales bacterium]